MLPGALAGAFVGDVVPRSGEAPRGEAGPA
jgi:hypothetical protein